MVLLAACGGAASPSDGSVAPSTAAEPSDVQSPEPAGGALAASPIGTIEKAPLGYLEYLPPSYGGSETSPLLISLHGAGEAGDGSAAGLELVDDLGVPQLIAAGEWPDDRPFVVLAPQYGTAAAEGECDIAAEIDSFIEFAIGHYEVDPERVYLTGISCGAIGIWDYLAEHGPDGVTAAVVPIAGHAEWALEKAEARNPGQQYGCEPLGQVPVWAFHGELDEVVPVVHIEDPMNQVTECYRPDPSDWKLTVYPDADHLGAIDRTYDLSAGHDIYAWLLDHTNH
jgi:dienelactone hydrolase